MIEKFMKEKKNLLIVGICCLLLIVGIVVVASNTGITYAESSSDYECPLGNYPSGSSTLLSNPYYTDALGYYCNLNKVPNGFSSASYTQGTSLAASALTDKQSTACYNYLNEMGYTYVEHSTSGCRYAARKKTTTVNCPAGTYYLGQGQCSTSCPANYYCPGGTFTDRDSSREGLYSCPTGTTSPEGSTSSKNCEITCAAGTYYLGQGQCSSSCPAGSYCPGGTFSISDSSREGLYSCPTGTTSPEGSTSSKNCEITCAAGTYYLGQGVCSTSCPAGSYCPGGTFSISDSSREGIYECPNGTTSPEGSTSQSACYTVTVTCSAGNYYIGQGKCDVCPANYYCPGGTFTDRDSSREGIYECPSGTTSSVGSVSCTGVEPDDSGNTGGDSGVDTPDTPATYTVSYNANGGSGAPANQTKTKGVTLTLSNVEPTRTGYEFKGWATISTAATPIYAAGGSYTTDAPVVLYAVWKIREYEVTYDANGGSGAPSSQTKYYNTNLTLSSTKPTRTGYDFKGWATTSTATTAAYAAGGSYTTDAAVTLYAVWNAKNYTVTYNGNGGLYNGSETYVDTNKAVYGSNYTSLSNNNLFVRKGYNFVGWNEKIDGTGTSRNAASSWKWAYDSNLTLYAQWNINTYKINYDAAGGKITGNPSTATYNEVVTINNPTKSVTIYCNSNNTDIEVEDNPVANFKFLGWSSEDIDTSSAYYGETPWKDKTLLVTDTEFKNLTTVNNGTVTLVANWDDAVVMLPSVTKEGYTCKWNTKSNGKGDSYDSGDKFTVDSDSTSVNLYAICEVASKADEEVDTNVKTGDVLIYVVWTVGIGALGYSVYYFMKRRNNI